MISNIKSYVLLSLSIILYSHILSYSFWEATVGPKLMLLFSAITVILFVYMFSMGKIMNEYNKRIIYFLVFWPLFSMLVNYSTGVSSLESYRINVLMSFAFMTYFIYRRFNTTEQQIIVTLTIFGLITLAIQTYQQINPDFIFFGIIGEYDGGMYNHVRNGVMRFYVGSYFIAIFCMYYYWEKSLTKFKVIYLLLFVLFFASMYLYMTRQIMISSVLTILFSGFLVTNKSKKKIFFLLLSIIVAIFIYYYDILFEQLVESYRDNTFTTDIRKQASDFIIDQILNNPIGSLIGYGHSKQEILWADKGFYLSDIGFIGEGYLYGIPWVVAYFIILYKYVIKYKNVVPLYVKLYFIGTAINSVMIFPYRNNIEAFVWLIAMYIGGMYINNNKIQET